MAKPKTNLDTSVPRHAEIIVPLNQLILSASNVRNIYDAKSINDFAESIAKKGLLQNLILRPCGDADGVPLYEIHAGGRRFRALQRLLSQGRIAPDFPVRAIVETAGVAADVSLTENTERENLHPLDEFRAFKTMKDEGLSDSAIAATYHVTPTVVKQRLRLVSASPKLLDAYGKGKLELEQLMAFCIIEDHKRQETLFKAIMNGTMNGQPWAIKRVLTENTIALTDRRVKFVGVKAYEAAGGTVLRDMFDTRDSGYIEHPEILARLVDEKLAAARSERLAEGWKWADASLDVDLTAKQAMGRITGTPTPLTKKEEKRLEKISTRMEEIDTMAPDEMDATDEDLQEEFENLEAEAETINSKPPVFSDADMARAGVLLSIDQGGNLVTQLGYVKPEDDVKPEAPAAAASNEEEPDDDNGLKPLSERLVQDLTSFRTVAMREAMSRDFRVAFVTTLHTMVLSHFYHASYQSCLQLSVRHDFPAKAPGLDTWGTTKMLDDRDEQLRKMLPKERCKLWAVLWAMTDDQRHQLFAHCAAMSLNAVKMSRADNRPNRDEVAHALGLSMVAAGWTPAGDMYLSRVSKPHILRAVEEALGEDKAHLIAHMKKEGMAKEAERLLSGTGWLPEVLRTVDPATLAATDANDDLDDGSDQLPDFLVDTAGAAAA